LITDASLGAEPDSYLRAEQLALLTRNRIEQYATILTSGVTVAVLWPLYPLWLLELWFGVSCGVVCLRAYLASRCDASVLTPEAVRNWSRILAVFITSIAFLWGAAGSAILLTPNLSIQFYVILITAGMMAGGVTGNAASRPALIGCGLAAQLPVICAVLAVHDSMHTALAALLTIYTAFILNTGLRFNKVIADNIQMRFNQGQLLISQERLLAQVQSSESEMAEAQQLAKTGSWSIDLRSQILTLSPEAYRIFGIDPTDPAPHLSTIMARVHPGDKAMLESLAAALFSGSILTAFDHRSIMDDGAIKYLHITPKTIFNDSRQAMRATGSVQDVTATRLAEERLLLSNLVLATQMEASPDGIQVANAAREMISFNQNFAEIWRVPPAEMKTGNDSFLRPHMIAQVKSPESYAARIQHIVDHPDEAGEDNVLLADGRILERHTRPLRTEDGQNLGRVWFFRDITARQAAAQKLEFTNILLNTQMEASPDGILVVDANNIIVALNKRYGKNSNARYDDLVGQNLGVALDRVRGAVSDPSALARRVAAVTENRLEISEAEFEMADGRLISRYTTPLRAANGDYLGRAWFYSDITERKQAENTLAYRDRLLHTVTAATAVAVGALSLADGVNAALAQIGERMGVDRILVVQNMPGDIPPLAVRFQWKSAAIKTSFKLIATGAHQFDSKQMAAWRAPLEDGKPVIGERKNATGAVRAMMEHYGTQSCLLMPVFVGGTYWGFLGISACAAPRDWAAAEIETMGILADITGSLIVRERARLALATSEQRFRLLTSTARDAVILSDEHGYILQWNRGAEYMFGYMAAEAVGQHVIRLLVPRSQKAEAVSRLATVNENTGLTMEMPIRRKDGTLIDIELSVSGARFGDRLEIIGIMRDITERKTAAQKLQFANILLETQMEASLDGILVVDSAGRITAVNQRYGGISGTGIDDLPGQHFSVTFDRFSALVKDPAAFLRSVSFRTENIAQIAGEEFELADGRFISRYMTPLRAANGVYLGRACFYTDITERKTAAEKLQFANILLGTQMEASPDGILVVDANRHMISCNRRFAEIWRLPAEMLNPGDDGNARRNHMLAQITAPDVYIARIQYLVAHPDEIGEDEVVTTDGRTLERYTRTLISSSGERLGRIWFFGDVTARKAAEQKLLLANTLLKTQMEAAPDGIYAVDASGRILSFNQRVAEMWSIPLALLEDGRTSDVRDQTAAMVKDPDSYLARITHLNEHPGETANDVLELNDGRIFERHSVAIQTAGQENLGRVWFCRDVTARRAADALALRLARYDALTGLANRTVFVEAVHQAIAHARRDRTGFAVLFLDLDHFKDVNDTLGHPSGDTLLKTVAARLQAATRETDTVGRFGGDEFAVILSGIQNAADAGVLAEKLIAAINIPLVIELNTVHVRASIGIELFSTSAEDSETLLAHADVALYRAKAEGRGTFRFFTAEMDRDVRSRVNLGTELREALGADEFVLLYQPQVEASTGALTGVEALIRWNHPTRGLLAPETFIEAAEANGAITQLGHFVLWTACRQAAAWTAAGHVLPRLSFNVSALQFKTAATLEAEILAALAETGLPPEMLELELTESALISTSQENNNVLRRLKALGIKLAIDDFGTGYSSLEYLRSFPADHIKIAQGFTRNVATEAGDASIVRAIISLAGELNIATIAEGIETRAQLDLIISWGCTQMQGFYYSRPVPPETIATILASGGILLPDSNL
jgi:diguanylate cyclase (GGDEF)-like protein/PAS domain S-box-containing protein